MAVALAAWNGPQAGGLPAHQFPAGINPQSCPNYPNCDNPLVAISASSPSAPAGYAAPQPQWNSAPAQAHNNYQPNALWNAPQAQQQYQPQPQWNSAPAQPQWNQHQQQQQQDNGQWNAQNPQVNGEYTGDGDYRGEGLQESGAFGDNSNMIHHN